MVMISKEDIVKILIKLNLPRSDYWVLAGSALVMHEVKIQTRDIDIGCTTELFEKLMLKGHQIVRYKDGTRSLHINDKIEVFENWMLKKLKLLVNYLLEVC